jgi:hypothetical protein
MLAFCLSREEKKSSHKKAQKAQNLKLTGCFLPRLASFCAFCAFLWLALIRNDYWLALLAFLQIRAETFAVLSGNLVNVHAQHPLLLPFFTGALRRDDFDDSFHRSFRQVNADEEQPADARQSGFGKPRADQSKPHPKLANGVAMTARWL